MLIKASSRIIIPTPTSNDLKAVMDDRSSTSPFSCSIDSAPIRRLTIVDEIPCSGSRKSVRRREGSGEVKSRREERWREVNFGDEESRDER